MYGCPSSLQFRQTFWVVFQAALALNRSSRGRAALNLRGKGKMTLGFAATHDPDCLAVSVEDLSLGFNPLELNFSIGAAAIRFPMMELGSDVFDLAGCHGLHYRRTGEFKLHLALNLRPDRFPQLLEIGVGAPLRVTIVEQGYMSLDASTLETQSVSFHVSQGLMHVLTVHPGQPDERPAVEFNNKFNTCDAQVEAAGVIGSGQSAAVILRAGQKNLHICRGTPVTLGWRATGNKHNTTLHSPLEQPPSLGVPDEGTQAKQPEVSTNTS